MARLYLAGRFVEISPEELLSCKTQRDLAKLLNVSTAELRNHLYAKSRPKYSVFGIDKAGGGVRLIQAPPFKIKMWQRALLGAFEKLYIPKTGVHGFVRTRSVLTGASLHLKKSIVLNFDIKDFFPSIHFGRVLGLFKRHPFNLPTEVAATLAQLCTNDGHLPQGAPTSPAISNFICRNLDREFLKLARLHSCVYSRYADDMTLSSCRQQLSKELIAEVAPRGSPLVLGSAVTEILNRNGFEENNSKSRSQTGRQHQSVTGVTVNVKPNLRREFVRNIRALYKQIQVQGYKNTELAFYARYCKPKPLGWALPPLHAAINGKLSYLRMIRGVEDKICTSLEISGSKLHRSIRFAVLRGESSFVSSFYREAVWTVVGKDRYGETSSNGTAFF